MHEAVTNPQRVTVATAGVYAIFAAIEYASGTNQRRMLKARLNGATDIIVTNAGPGGTAIAPVTFMGEYRLVATDYVEILGRQDSGGALLASAGTYSPQFTMRWVRP